MQPAVRTYVCSMRCGSYPLKPAVTTLLGLLRQADVDVGARTVREVRANAVLAGREALRAPVVVVVVSEEGERRAGVRRYRRGILNRCLRVARPIAGLAERRVGSAEDLGCIVGLHRERRLLDGERACHVGGGVVVAVAGLVGRYVAAAGHRDVRPSRALLYRP